jgi:hypothetical protein
MLLPRSGVILMVVGAIGLFASLFEQTLWADRRRRRAVEPGVVREREYR